MHSIIASLTLFLTFAVSSLAQDTLHLSLQRADSMFLARNYYLLASSMNIEAQKAQIIQSKLYPNPIFTADLNAYDPQHQQAFHVGPTGQKAFQVEQLILLGGKRKAQIDLAKTNADIAELEFQQLILELKFRLHSDLYTIGQQRFLLNKYTKQLEFLDTLMNSYSAQASKGNIPLQEVVRLKGAYIELNNDKTALYKEFVQTQADLQTLLQTDQIILPSSTDSDLKKYIKLISLQEIQDSAKTNLPQFLIMQQNKVLAEEYLSFQKRMAVPDINVFTSYDQRGGAFNNQVNAGISIPLPLWNQNRGNIKTAKFQVQQADYNLKAKESELTNQINNSYKFYLQTVAEYQKAMLLYNNDFELTANGMNTNFQKRNVSIIEFIDFFENYNDVLAEILRIKTQVVISAEQLNLLTGKDIY